MIPAADGGRPPTCPIDDVRSTGAVKAAPQNSFGERGAVRKATTCVPCPQAGARYTTTSARSCATTRSIRSTAGGRLEFNKHARRDHSKDRNVHRTSDRVWGPLVACMTHGERFSRPCERRASSPCCCGRQRPPHRAIEITASCGPRRPSDRGPSPRGPGSTAIGFGVHERLFARGSEDRPRTRRLEWIEPHSWQPHLHRQTSCSMISWRRVGHETPTYSAASCPDSHTVGDGRASRSTSDAAARARRLPSAAKAITAPRRRSPTPGPRATGPRGPATHAPCRSTAASRTGLAPSRPPLGRAPTLSQGSSRVRGVTRACKRRTATQSATPGGRVRPEAGPANDGA
jgi:hypothetical protein